MSDLGIYAEAGFEEAGALYLVVGSNVVKWDAGSGKMTAIWTSKAFRTATPTNFACAKIVASSYPVTFQLEGNGVTRYLKAVSSSEPFWLPGNYKCDRYRITLTLTNPKVKAVHVATTMDELRRIG